ncbi:MAG: L,D-transpeptidase family protein, partial [Polaromonas sp.]|nr:L,D-transpeptidase family protein [Polaromonas sp.]
GQAYAGLEMLAQRLAALGDLATDAPTLTRYEGSLVDAVKAFQQRHGLAADGVIGKATMAQLQVTPAARVRQIELMLERLRWTPLMQGPRMIVINIPEFVLSAYEVQGGRIVVRQEMKVIVGKALDTRTPLFNKDMRFIEFSPYWNIPPSIARAEIVPRLRRDPGYFEREGLEFVSPDGRVDTTLSAERLDAVLAGQMRIRQRPGPQNALGDIKFVLPNRDNIYLHHTPAAQLFERDRRDFSHGCIRVEQPVALAKFVLEGMPEWTEDRIRQAMGRGESATLRLTEPVPVLIAYGTTLVKHGRIFFFEDIYGLDRLLDAALRRHARHRPPINSIN